MASQRVLSYARRVEVRLVLLAHLLGLLSPLIEIGLDLRALAQVVCDHIIDVGKLNGWVLEGVLVKLLM